MFETGLNDKNGKHICIGNTVRLVLEDGEVREFEVCWKTVTRTVKSHPDFDDEYAKVNITGVVFSWNSYDLFPCVDKNGISDTSKMEVIDCSPCGRCQNEDGCDGCIRNPNNDDFFYALNDNYYHD